MNPLKFIKKIFNFGVSSIQGWPMGWFFGGGRVASGEMVNERTALGLSAYLACIKNISEDIGKLPCGVYKRLQPRGRQEMRNHPADLLMTTGSSLVDPYPEMTAMTFRETLTAHALGWHGGFAEIVRDGSGKPIALYVLDPTFVQVMRDKQPPYEIYYLVYGQRFEKSDIFHIHGLGYDGVTGYVLSRLARDPIGNALAAQKFAGAFFANGTITSGVIEVPAAMTETGFKHLRESFHARHGGGENQHKPIILENGAKFTPTSTDPQKSQMLETLMYGVEDVARLFRMPLHKIGHLERSTNNNIEQQALEYVQDTLLAWLVRWEQEICRKLLMPSERKTLYAHFCVDALLRGDVAARGMFYQLMRNIGVYSANDVREKEDDNPISEADGGDAYLVNMAMAPQGMVAEGKTIAAKQPSGGENPPGEPKTAPKKPAGEPGYSANEHKKEIVGRIAAAHTKFIEREIADILRVEKDKVMRAMRRSDFTEWADNFYGKTHQKHVSHRLRPLVKALAASLEGAKWN
jgi:HK97 family phage portal protein